MRFLLCAVAGALLVLGSPVWGQANVAVDWRQGTVTAVGRGFAREGLDGVRAQMMAQRAARVVALRSMAEFIQGVQVSSETTVEDAMMAADVIRAGVHAVVKQAHQVGESQFDPTGMALVTMQVKFEGSLANAVLPQEGFQTAPPVAPPISDAPPAAPDASRADVTGLVIDARGLKLVSAMVPKILSEDGQVIYGPAQVSREAAVQNGGLAGYEKDLDAAQKNDRVGPRPMVVKGLAGNGAYRANVVVSDADAQEIRRAAEGRTFLNQCRVVMAID